MQRNKTTRKRTLKTHRIATKCSLCGNYGVLYYTGSKGRFDCPHCGYRVTGPELRKEAEVNNNVIYPFCSFNHPIAYGEYKTKKKKTGWYFRCLLCRRTTFTWHKELAERWIKKIQEAKKPKVKK